MAKSTKKTPKKTATKKSAVKGSTKKPAKTTAKKTSRTKLDTTHIIAILDRSGSMKSVSKAAIDGFNEFLASQKKLKGKATMTVAIFDDVYEVLYDNYDLKDVPELTDKTFVPRNWTALYDAMGRSIGTYKAKLEKMEAKARPDKVLVVTITDGIDNASSDYTASSVKAMVEEQKKADWQFLFLCSTEDTLDRANTLGIDKGNTMKFANTNLGNQMVYASISSASTKLRSLSKKSMSVADYNAQVSNLFSDDDKNKA